VSGQGRHPADLELPWPLEAVAGLDDERTSAQTSREGLMAKRRFGIVSMKPSHHDDDGYLIQWAALAHPFEPRHRIRDLRRVQRGSNIR
jgi:hypothetical protein